jgi:hypothetical protein
MTIHHTAIAALFAAALCVPAIAPAAAADFEPEFRTLGLGQAAADLTTEGYELFACGSNGGPPLNPLTGWVDYMQCRPEASGLREVYAEYGRQIGQLANMFKERYDDELWIQKYGGTRMANQPVVMSLLFDETGIVRGFRVVTDQRAPGEERGKAYLFRLAVMSKYATQDKWACIKQPPGPGITPVGGVYINDVCELSQDGKNIRVEAHLYRKEGQTGVDYQGMYAAGQYESLTRWEVLDASLPGPG